ncbi:hypothetical protein SAMN05216391_10961 [Lachnospiraceae bacterium KHCPX20]|nr:hypothetical protein SAMN05216391_10961 [Lachnospiraceae bacterium KHCPX20]
MIRINTKGMLSEKKTKELVVSLNLFVSAAEKKLSQECRQGKCNTRFTVEFDNGNTFRIMVQLDSDNHIRKNIEYEDNTGRLLTTIGLQEALNLIKYVREFEHIIKHGDINGKSFRGYFTEQSLERNIAIFAERDVKERFIDKDELSHFSIETDAYNEIGPPGELNLDNADDELEL